MDSKCVEDADGNGQQKRRTNDNNYKNNDSQNKNNNRNSNYNGNYWGNNNNLDCGNKQVNK